MRYLILLPFLFLAGCAGMTPAEVTGAVVTGTGALVAFVQALSPMLEPEQVAKLTAIASQVEGTTEALAQALSVIAEQFGSLKQETDAGWTQGEVLGASGGLAGATLFASRLLSMLKHRKPAQPTP